MTDSMAQEIVATHNKYRTQVGFPPIKWSNDLASQAQQWANYLTSNRLFKHSGAKGEGETSSLFSSQLIEENHF